MEPRHFTPVLALDQLAEDRPLAADAKRALRFLADERVDPVYTEPNIVTLEGLHEGLSDAVGLWASDRVKHGTRPTAPGRAAKPGATADEGDHRASPDPPRIAPQGSPWPRRTASRAQGAPNHGNPDGALEPVMGVGDHQLDAAQAAVPELVQEGVAKLLHASWQRCRVHFARNALAYAGKNGRRVR